MILNILLLFAVLAVCFFSWRLYHYLTTMFSLASKGKEMSDEDVLSILAYKIRVQRDLVVWGFCHMASLGLSVGLGIYPLAAALFLKPFVVGFLIYGHWHTYCRR